MKKCPYCAEVIQDEALVCPHCRRNLTTNVYASQQPAPVQPNLAGDAYPVGQPGQPETSGKAIGSLVSGIVGVLIPFLGAVTAIILGHLGLGEIRKSAGRLKGDGLAIAGLVLGYLECAFFVFLIIPAILIPNLIKSRMAANEASAVGSLRTITSGEIAYASACPKIGFAYALVEMGPTGSACPEAKDQLDTALARGVKDGYRFTPDLDNFTGQVPETGFGWNADPISPASGRRHFFVDQSGVIRFSVTGRAGENSEILK